MDLPCTDVPTDMVTSVGSGTVVVVAVVVVAVVVVGVVDGDVVGTDVDAPTVDGVVVVPSLDDTSDEHATADRHAATSNADRRTIRGITRRFR